MERAWPASSSHLHAGLGKADPKTYRNNATLKVQSSFGDSLAPESKFDNVKKLVQYFRCDNIVVIFLKIFPLIDTY